VVSPVKLLIFLAYGRVASQYSYSDEAETPDGYEAPNATPSRLPQRQLDHAFTEPFSACVDCLESMQRDRPASRDHLIMETKFGNPEARFTAWGNACGLDDLAHYDERIDCHSILDRAYMPHLLVSLNCSVTVSITVSSQELMAIRRIGCSGFWHFSPTSSRLQIFGC
jgi:hypothetical protein